MRTPRLRRASRLVLRVGLLATAGFWSAERPTARAQSRPPTGLQAVAESLATETIQGIQARTPPRDNAYRVGVLAFQVNNGPAPALLSPALKTLNAQYVESLRQANTDLVARREAAIRAEPGRADAIRRDPAMATFRVLDHVELNAPAEEAGVEVRSATLGDPERRSALLQRLGLDVLVSANVKADAKTFGDPGVAPGQIGNTPLEVELSWADAAGKTATAKRPIAGETLPLPADNASKARDKDPNEGGSRFFVNLYLADPAKPDLPKKTPLPLKQVDPRVATQYPAFRRVLFYEVNPDYRGRLFVQIGVKPGPPVGFRNPSPTVEAERLYAASLLLEGVDSFALSDPTADDPKRPRYRLAEPDKAGLWLLSPPGKILLPAGPNDPKPLAAKDQAYRLEVAGPNRQDHTSHLLKGFQTTDGAALAFTFSEQSLAASLTANPGLLSRDHGTITVTFFAQKRDDDQEITASLGSPAIGAGQEVEQRIQRIKIIRHDQPVDTWRIFLYRPDAPSESIPPPEHLVAIPVWIPGSGQ